MIHTDRLREILDLKHTEILNQLWERLKPIHWTPGFESRLEEEWTEYLNGLDCTVVEDDELLEDLETIINFSAQGRVCVSMDNEGGKLHILVPRELAEKALVLGGLPESWFPERERPER